MGDPNYSDHESNSKMLQEPPPPDPAAEGEWKLESVNIRTARNGGYIVSCQRTRQSSAQGGGNGTAPQQSNYESNDYAFGDKSELFSFLDTELGGATAQGAGSAPSPVAVGAKPGY